MTTRHSIVEDDLARICAESLPWTEFDGAEIVVSGGSGFIAAYLIEALLYRNEHYRAGLSVTALVRNADRARRRFAAYDGRTDLRILTSDICAPLPADLRADFVAHAASQASPKHFASDPVGTLAPNTLGTHHLLSLAHRSQARSFVFLSSGEVYGRVPKALGRALREDDYGPLDPLEVRACYGEGKRAGEAMCRAWHVQHNVPACIARLGHTYGPGMDLADGRVFADFTSRMVRGENIVLESDGIAVRPFCYLTDAVSGLLLLMLRGAPGTAYNLVNDEGAMRIRDLAACLVNLHPERGQRVVFSGAPPDPAAPVSLSPGIPVDTTRLRQLGWKPQVGVVDGFRRTILSYT